MVTPEIRLARAEDMPAVCALVNVYIETTAANFNTAPLTTEHWLEQWRQLRDTHPWYVAEADGAVAGICYARPWSPRGAYAWTAECTVYVAPRRRGLGIGSGLYARLLATLKAQGFHSVIAGLTLPNPASEALHRAQGFEPVGAFRAIGHKHGAWHDVSYWQRHLSTDAAPPVGPGPAPVARAGPGTG